MHALKLEEHENRSYTSKIKSQLSQFSVTFVPGMLLSEIEMNVILSALKAHRGNKTHAAKSLGIGLRTLQRKIKYYEAMDPDCLI